MPTATHILDYLNPIYRYWLVAVCALVVGVVMTGWTVHSLPDMYQSTTLIMVEPQDVPESYVRPSVSSRVEQRLQALSQEVLSRTRLEAIINDFGLFPELRKQNVPREQMVTVMRGKIQISVFAKDNAFRISYEDRDPINVQRVTARLASLYIDENLRIRDEHVTGTAEFMQSELEKVGKQLADQEQKLQAFKEQHIGELPEQRETNLRTLEGVRLQLQTNSVALSSAMERKLLLAKQAGDARSVLSTQPAGGGKVDATNPAVRLQQLQAQLADQRGRYTDEHPDVIHTQSEIAGIMTELKIRQGSDSRQLDPLLPPDLARALQQVQLDISRLQQEEENLRKAIDTYQHRVESTFAREQELQSLNRDYTVTEKKYQTLLDKKLEAQLSQSLERRQKGERFRVLDPASLPEAPVRPNRQLLTLGGVAASFGLAFLLPILLWQLDTSFHLAEEVAACSLPVLAVIPQAPTPDVDRRLRRYRIRVLAFSALGLVIGLCSVSLYGKYVF